MAKVVTFGEGEECSYRLENPWGQPPGRLSEFTTPFTLPAATYREADRARLVTRRLFGVDRNHRVIEEMMPFTPPRWRSRLRLGALSFLPPSRRIDRPLCSLISPWGLHNAYFHWFLDHLPVLFAAEHYARRTGNPFTVLAPATLTEWQSASLSRLGYEAKDLTPFLPGTRFTSLETTCLIASRRHRYQPSSGVPYDAMSPAAVARLGERLRGRETATGPPLRLVIIRRERRRFVNQDAVLEVLSGHGFQAVHLEGMPLADQIDLFSRATHIVAVHGAGLTNLLHARGASVLELHSQRHGIRPEYFQLAALNQCRYVFHVCESQGDTNDVEVDLNILHAYLEAAL